MSKTAISAARPSADTLAGLFAQRIVVLDGAMGSMIQTYRLGEQEFRGALFAAHPHDLKGNNDILCLTRPDVIEEIHSAYFDAGADMVETNTFSATVIAQADYQTQAHVREINLAAARIARRAADKAEAATPGRRCFVAGNLARSTEPSRFRLTSIALIIAPSLGTRSSPPMPNKPRRCSPAASTHSSWKPSSTHSTPRRRCSPSKTYSKKQDDGFRS